MYVSLLKELSYCKLTRKTRTKAEESDNGVDWCVEILLLSCPVDLVSVKTKRTR